MDWTAIFGALTNWISGGSTLRCVSYEDAERVYDDYALASFLVDNVSDVDLLDTGYRLDDANGNVYTTDGAVELALRIIFIAHSNAPDDFALHWSELFRARARMQPILQILSDAGMVVVEIGTSTYFEEVRDQRIFSRAELSVRLRVCVHYESDPAELGPEGPVEQVEVTTDWENPAGDALPPSLQLDRERIPPDAPPPPIDSALELDPIAYYRADQEVDLLGLDVTRWGNLSTRGGSNWDLLEDTLSPRFVAESGGVPDHVLFDGNERLPAPANTNIPGGSMGLFVVFRIVAPSVNGMIFVGRGAAYELRQTAGGGTVEGRISPVTLAGPQDETGVLVAYLFNREDVSNSGELWRNGSSVASTSSASPGATTMRPSLGARVDGALGANVEIYEAGIFDRILDLNDRLELFDYFSRRYGI